MRLRENLVSERLLRARREGFPLLGHGKRELIIAF